MPRADDDDVRQLRLMGLDRPVPELMHVPRERLHRARGESAGQDAVAEIEDVARPPAGAAQDIVRRVEHADRPGRAAAPDRGCPGCRDRRRSWSHASSSGARQSTPMTSPPASAHVRQDRAGADAEVDRRHAGSGERRRRSAACAAARTRGSRRATAARPTNRRSGSPARPPRSARACSRPIRRAKRSQRRCHAAGCAYMNALVFA